MTDKKDETKVKIRAKSPGEYPILIVELPSGELRVAYYETGYDLGQTKPAEEDWVRQNAIGRHSFEPVEPPEEVSAGALMEYAVNSE
jgi:hypothetical protein